ncbi:MAG: hypothetical protein ACW99Q_25055, partial [Candidatus Kariarchaeaceae archaeon]
KQFNILNYLQYASITFILHVFSRWKLLLILLLTIYNRISQKSHQFQVPPIKNVVLPRRTGSSTAD